MFSSNTSQVSEDRLYVEDVFSTYLYNGNSSARSIDNGIDLAGKGGMVWIKTRTQGGAGWNHVLFDTSRGANKILYSNDTSNQNSSFSDTLTGFNSNGFSLGADASTYWVNQTGYGGYASWTFRKAPKFFDVVTYTGTGSAQNIAHSLGSVPGCILVKRTDTTADWQVYHRSNANTQYMVLNTTAAVATGTTRWNSTTPTASVFTVGTDTTVNASGGTYVAYLFAHDTTSDGIIQCGSYTGNGSATGPTVTLGWEPQWLLVKDATSAWDWRVVDNMRGMPVGSGAASLFPNLSNAEFTTSTVAFSPTATGFQVAGSAAQINTNGNTYIYIAIRRGPMRTPTLGTSVFAPALGNNMAAANVDAFTSGFPTDLLIRQAKSGSEGTFQDALRGVGGFLYSSSTAAESVSTTYARTQTGISRNVATNFSDWIGWNFRRAPSFFDEVCYTGTGSALSVSHNLGVIPDIVIIKRRDSANQWVVMCPVLGYDGSGNVRNLFLNLDNAAGYTVLNNNSTITSSSIPLVGGGFAQVNASGGTYVAYLFASAPGVSKVGSYTGNGSSQTINCGFAAGARFVMIKRTDSTGDWYVWDSARGIVSGNDPHLSLNTTAAEVTTDDSVDTDSSGFVVNQLSATNINVSSATYIYLAVA